MHNSTLTTRLICAALVAVIRLSAAAEQREAIPLHSSWHYLDEITNGRSGTPLEDYPRDAAGRQWFEFSFDMASSTPSIGTWKQGETIIGSGILNAGPIQTQVPLINDFDDGFSRITTLLFRRSFTVSTAEVSSHAIELSMLMDDAGVLYLNGVEVLRHNLPVGEISTNTYALQPGNEDSYEVFWLPSTLLVEGTNQIAFELHNVSDINNDMGFDLSLRLIVPEPTGALVMILGFGVICWQQRRDR